MTIVLATVQGMRRLIDEVRGELSVSVEIHRDTRFVADLGLASLELIGFVFLCEQTFNVGLVDQPGLLAQLHTVGQAVDAVRELQVAAAMGEPVTGELVAASGPA